LKQWRSLVKDGPPRKIELASGLPADVVIFTDGSYPDDRKEETMELNPPMIGAVMLSRVHLQPVQGLSIVPQELINTWLPRKNQICMIELLAPIAALWTWRHYLREKFVLLLIDSDRGSPDQGLLRSRGRL